MKNVLIICLLLAVSYPPLPWILRTLYYRSCHVYAVMAQDDDSVGIPRIPYCRQGHGQVSLTSNRNSRDAGSQDAYIFGGKGINYNRPTTRFLSDLWKLSISPIIERTREGSDASRYFDFAWQEVERNNDDPWPSARWDFGSTSFQLPPLNEGSQLFAGLHSSQDVMLIFGGENDDLPTPLLRSTQCRAYWNLQQQNNEVKKQLNQSRGYLFPQFALSSSELRGEAQRFLLGDMWMLVNGTKWVRLLEHNHCPRSPNSNLANEFYLNNRFDSSEGNGVAVVGPRKGARLTVLPLTKTVAMFGGIGPPFDPLKEKYESEVSCLPEVYTLDIQTALRNIENSNHNVDIFKQHQYMQGPCLTGAGVTGIIDPKVGKEKLFVFGGRYRRTEYPELLYSDSHMRSASKKNSKFVYSNVVWMYDPIDKVWETIEKTGKNPDDGNSLKQPAGRYSHSIIYIEEKQRIFMAGGSSRSGRSATSSYYLDLWSFDLRAHEWMLHTDSPADFLSSSMHSSNGFPLPVARSRFSLSVLRMNFTDDATLQEIQYVLGVAFGGKHIDPSESERKSMIGHTFSTSTDPLRIIGETKKISRFVREEDEGWNQYSFACNGGRQTRRLEGDYNSHSEKNDVWAFIVNQDVNEINCPGNCSWTLISGGGCHAFDDGRRHNYKINSEALIIVAAVGGSVLVGICAYHFLMKGRQWQRKRGYSNISDDSTTEVQLTAENLYRFTADRGKVQDVGQRLEKC